MLRARPGPQSTQDTRRISAEPSAESPAPRQIHFARERRETLLNQSVTTVSVGLSDCVIRTCSRNAIDTRPLPLPQITRDRDRCSRFACLTFLIIFHKLAARKGASLSVQHGRCRQAGSP